ncbi:MAG: hypothetical protein K6E19_02205 [Lachnospiraceae bacterium]|nr:hypothetical protein [Lachnospiraceae bacterium]
MNGGNLLTVLLSSIKSKFTSIVAKIKLWTSWNYIKSQVIIRIRQFFIKLLDVRPKSQKDYYGIFGWLVSKRLAYAAVIILGVLSIWYIFSVRSAFVGFGAKDNIRTYKYNSVQLRMAKDKVRILGKSGYLAYEGNVSKGYVNGEGTLFAPAGYTVYRGNFEKNKFEGTGQAFYPSGVLTYEGTFHDNLYDGEGKLYRENGSLYYDGGFTRGLKNGDGKLCAENGKVIFTGLFSNDELVYSAFVGKTAEEAGQMYTGPRRIWNHDDEYCVYMKDINAIYYGDPDPDSLESDVIVNGIYVIADALNIGQVKVNTISAVKDIFGAPLYEGNSDAILSEAVIINLMNETRPVFAGPVSMKEATPFTDLTQIASYDEDYVIYLTSFKCGDLIYTFYSEDRNDRFLFYSIKGIEEEG